MDQYEHTDDNILTPQDEVGIMDQVQTQANRDIGHLLPMDPAAEAAELGIDEPEEAEPIDLGIGVEDELFDF